MGNGFQAEEDVKSNPKTFCSPPTAVPEIEVESVAGGRAELPCDVTPSKRDDSVHMVLWFRDDFPKPVYR